MIFGLFVLLFLIVLAMYTRYSLTIAKIQLRLLQDAIAASTCPLTCEQIRTMCRETEAQAIAL